MHKSTRDKIVRAEPFEIDAERRREGVSLAFEKELHVRDDDKELKLVRPEPLPIKSDVIL